VLNEPASHPEVIQHLVDLAIKYGRVQFLIENILPTNAKPVVGAIINGMAPRDDFASVVPGDYFLSHFTSIKEVLSEENMTSIVGNLTTNDQLVDKIQTHDFNQEYAPIYLRILRSTEEVCDDFYNLIAKGLRNSVSPDTWSNELRQPTDLLQLLFELVTRSKNPNMPPSFGDAIANNMLETMEATSSLGGVVQDNGSVLLDAMDAGAKKAFLYSLFNFVAGQDQRSISPVLAVFGDELYSALLMDKHEDYFLTLFKNILLRNDIGEIEWVHRALSNSSLISDTSDESKQSFVARIRDKYAQPETEAEIKAELEQIAELLGVDLKERENSEGLEDNFGSWTAQTNTTNSRGISLKELATGGRIITSLSFTVKSENDYWRAGVLFEGPNKVLPMSEIGSMTPGDDPLAQKDSLLFHVGRNDYSGMKMNELRLRDKKYCATAYYDQEPAVTHPKNRFKQATLPEVILDNIVDGDSLDVQVKYDKGNGIEFWVNGKKIDDPNATSLSAVDPEIFHRVYLVAWADGKPGNAPDAVGPREYVVEFSNVLYRTVP
jgi:hypothetical protein